MLCGKATQRTVCAVRLARDAFIMFFVMEAAMTNVTVQLSDREIEALKARTGKRSAAAALKAWAAHANAKRSIAELRAALKDSLKQEAASKGRRFGSGREAIRWLES